MAVALHPAKLQEAINTSVRVQKVRAAIAQTEHEISRAQEALQELPTWALQDLLSRGEEKLQRLRQSEAEAVAQAERIALAEHRERVVENCRAEAEPKLANAAVALANVRQILREVAVIEQKARAHGGQVMHEAFDENTIAYFLPQLEFLPSRGIWALKR